jgi:hypothetical protein
MRMIAFAFAALVAVSPAHAQSWQEYNYPVYSFSVSFPGEPKVETTMYQAFNGRMVEARVYSLAMGNDVLKMTVADLSDGDMEEKPVIDHAIKTLSTGGEIKVDIPHRISAVYGRQLAITGADGSHNSAAVFFYKRRLYQIEGKAASRAGTADAIRFQQSLSFTDGQSNRTPGGRLFEVFGRLF